MPDLPKGFELKYRSGERGFDNQWDLFADENTAVISIRGSVGSLDSWMENFYAAMIPAEGKIQIGKESWFEYKLAESKLAKVHVGWTMGLGSIAEDVVSKINEYHAKGYRNFYVIGYSKGAAMAQLLRSYLQYLPEGKIPKDIQFKTFAFACPKTGNMEYNYDYTYMNRGGWEFRLVNRADWVPRVPFTVQQVEDMPELNPFLEVKSMFKSLKPFQRAIIKGLYNKLRRKIKRAAKGLKDVFGDKVRFIMKKKRPFISEHEHIESFAYFPAGTTIVIKELPLPDSLSLTRKLFFHHMPLNYLKALQEDFKH